MKQNKKLIIGLFILLIITFLLYINLNNSNNNDSIISMQNEKIKDLEDKLNSEKIDNDEKKDKEEEEEEEEEDNSDEKNILDSDENIWNDLNLYKLYNDAEEYYENKEYEKAILNLKIIVEMESDASWAFKNLAKSYSKIGDFPKAIEIYKDLITRFPNDSWYYGQLGIFFNENNQKEKWSLFLIIWFLLDWKSFEENDLKDTIDKKMYDLEYETIKEFISNREYEELRKYIFSKYLWEKSDEYDLEDNS